MRAAMALTDTQGCKSRTYTTPLYALGVKNYKNQYKINFVMLTIHSRPLCRRPPVRVMLWKLLPRPISVQDHPVNRHLVRITRIPVARLQRHCERRQHQRQQQPGHIDTDIDTFTTLARVHCHNMMLTGTCNKKTTDY